MIVEFLEWVLARTEKEYKLSHEDLKLLDGAAPRDSSDAWQKGSWHRQKIQKDTESIGSIEEAKV